MGAFGSMVMCKASQDSTSHPSLTLLAVLASHWTSRASVGPPVYLIQRKSGQSCQTHYHKPRHCKYKRQSRCLAASGSTYIFHSFLRSASSFLTLPSSITLLFFPIPPTTTA